MVLRRVIRAGAWTFFVSSSLLASFYLLLVILNWNDEPPSAEVERFVAMARERPPVADEANGFVHALGISAPSDVDAVALGRERLAWLEGFVASHASEAFASFPSPDVDHRSTRGAKATALATACVDAVQCSDALDAEPDAVAEWLASDRLLLERYRRMLDAGRWREVIAYAANMPLPPYRHALDAQKLHLLDARRFAITGQSEDVRDLLQRDLVFWREVLASSDQLITKMIAVAAIKRHFAFGGLALRELPRESIEAAMPASWRTPLTDAERSMVRVFGGEWHFSVGAITRVLSDDRVDSNTTWLGEMAERLIRPLLQPQHTLNLSAERMVRLGALSERPYPELASALRENGAANDGTLRFPGVHNPVGTLVDMMVIDTVYTDYVPRVHDLEGVRRAALLVATLHAANVRREDARQAIADARLRNPYDDSAFEWDPVGATVTFRGLQDGDKGRHVLPY